MITIDQAILQDREMVRKGGAVLTFLSVNFDKLEIEYFLKSFLENAAEGTEKDWLDALLEIAPRHKLEGIRDLLAAFDLLGVEPYQLVTDTDAIAFALDHLHDHERIDFLQEWRDGRDVRWAQEVIAADNELAEELARQKG